MRGRFTERGAPCPKCGAPCETWNSTPRSRVGGSWLCGGCRRARKLFREYGITEAQYNALFVDQAGRCAICLNDCASGKWLSVDHDHATGKVRGLLCAKCNQALGSFADDVARLRAAIRYLQAGSENAE